MIYKKFVLTNFILISVHAEVVSKVLFLVNHKGIRGLAEETEDWKSDTYFSASSAEPLFSLWLKYF